MDIDEQLQHGAHALAARNVAIAMQRYGYKPPAPRAQASRPAAAGLAAQVPKLTPVPTHADAAAHQASLVRQAAAARAQQEAKAAVETKASWSRAVAKINANAGNAGGKPVAQEPKPELHGWAKVIARFNASANPRSAGRGPAPR